jgi:spermidine synthase
MIVFPLLKDNSINSITIIENDQEIVDFVGEKISNLDVSKKVKILFDDAFNYFKNTQDYGKYDYIYIDFWSTITQESISEMEYLMTQYSPFKKDESSFLRCWTYDIKHIIL